MPEKITNPVALAVREFYISNLARFPNARQCAAYLEKNGIVVTGLGRTFISEKSARNYLVGLRRDVEKMRRNSK